MQIKKSVFVKSVSDASFFIDDGKKQIVFAGKSNVGKSSVISALAGKRNFARAGKSPGKTVYINYFLINDAFYFTDLPGYGYAKVSKAERDRWGELMEAFFARLDLISAGIFIVDARHAPTKDDVLMCEWFKSSGKPFITIANKSDKIGAAELLQNLDIIRKTLDLPEKTVLMPFSAEKGRNRAALLSEIEKACLI